mmetsp:Transcript_2796/g.12510  ORF Transcript_2796/g.12510 Transcript_2796/m.12510 type:complete len:224 (-) Transcript_2796:3532-4203(-)
MHLPPIRLEDAQPFPGLTLRLLTLANASTALALDEVIARAKHAAEALADDRHVGEIREGLDGLIRGLLGSVPVFYPLSLDLRVGVLILLIHVHGVGRILVLVVLPVGRVRVLVVLPVARGHRCSQRLFRRHRGRLPLDAWGLLYGRRDHHRGGDHRLREPRALGLELYLGHDWIIREDGGGQVAVVLDHRGERILESNALRRRRVGAPVAARRRNREVLLRIR